MAQLLEENVVIKLSRLVKKNDAPELIITDELLATIEQVVQELVGGAIVEVEKV